MWVILPLSRIAIEVIFTCRKTVSKVLVIFPLKMIVGSPRVFCRLLTSTKTLHMFSHCSSTREASFGSDGLWVLRSGRPPLLPLLSSPFLWLSSFSLSSGSGSPPVLPGEGGGWLFAPWSTSFPILCRGVDAAYLSGFIPSGGIQGFCWPRFEGAGSPSLLSVGGMVKWGLSAPSILAVKVCIIAWNSNCCLSIRSHACWRSLCCWVPASSFCCYSSWSACFSWSWRIGCQVVSWFLNLSFSSRTCGSRILSRYSANSESCFFCTSCHVYSPAIPALSRSFSTQVAPSRVAKARLASVISWSTTDSPFASRVCCNCKVPYWTLASYDYASKAISCWSWLSCMVDEIILNACAICRLRSSVAFVRFLECCRVFEWVADFPIK